MKTIHFFPLFLCLLLLSCTGEVNKDQQKAAVQKVIENNILWFKDKDFDLLFSTMTNGPDLFMFQLDSESTIDGFEQFRKYSEGWKNPLIGYAGHRFTDLRISLSPSADVAWFSTILEDCAMVQDRPTPCFTSRYTGVLEKREGRWLIVQQHFSLPAESIAPDWIARTAHPPSI